MNVHSGRARVLSTCRRQTMPIRCDLPTAQRGKPRACSVVLGYSMFTPGAKSFRVRHFDIFAFAFLAAQSVRIPAGIRVNGHRNPKFVFFNTVRWIGVRTEMAAVLIIVVDGILQGRAQAALVVGAVVINEVPFWRSLRRSPCRLHCIAVQKLHLALPRRDSAEAGCWAGARRRPTCPSAQRRNCDESSMA